MHLILAAVGAIAEAASVCVNQTGFEPDAIKEFIIRNPPAETFVVQTIDPSVAYRNVLTGKLTRVNGDLWKGDFSAIREPADYRILCGGDMANRDVILPYDYPGAACHSFVIRTNHYETAERFMFTFFTWQRCGSRKGWAGLCHQDPVPLYGTGRALDMRGGYHQSGDLRGWADGISLSVYALLRWAELRKPLWDGGEVEEELRWGLDYFLKLVGPEGYAYDCQFVPIGWGPRDYYPQPAPLTANMNIAALLARAAARFRGDGDYSRKLLETARRMWRCLEIHPAFDRNYREMVGDLPPGCQPASFYPQCKRGTAVHYSGMAFAALELHRATGERAFADAAKEYGRKLVDLQIKEGPLSGAYFNDARRAEVGFRDCSYGTRLNGYRTTLELHQTFGDEAFRDAYLRSCELIVRMLDADSHRSIPSLARNALEVVAKRGALKPALVLLGKEPPYLTDIREGTSTTGACLMQLMLNEAVQRLGRADFAPYAARARDWMYGKNPAYACYVTGLGYNHRRRNVFGQFFPSTPPIPGGVCHVLNGEYDLPAAGMALWASASEK